ncbi:AAA family ATPase [Curtobacterium sp. SP.BCo]|uniref:AAA family ATPase n=1 Tax=Curtobacterium sp. SP.BCo TaxID=3435229 RepID=UPI003F735294
MTAVLLHLNGIPASGKSTVARAWVERHAASMPVALDIDVLRSMIGGWQAALRPAGIAARGMATAAMRVHLRSGRDVVVPQYARSAAFVDELAALAADEDSVFVEWALWADAAQADRRFAARAAAGTGVHGDLGGDRMVDVLVELEAFLATRERLTRVGGPDQGLGAVLDELDVVVATARGLR